MKLQAKTFFTSLLLLTALLPFAQTKPVAPTAAARPKLVVGIVVDQMRYDYLYRYSEKYSSGGFKRLLREGYSCENTHINYSPSYTACGHTCIYTGSVPSVHGITGNDWYDLKEGKKVYCTEDTTMSTVGSASKAGKMSPQRMLVTTVTDELRLATNFQSKTIGIALKDRGAILPAGHSANAAYFFDGSVGGWITSSYYMHELPGWAKTFNDKKLAEKYVAQNWNTLLPIAQYFESDPDNEPYEGPYKNETNAVFEHKVSEITPPSIDVVRATPYGNTLTLDFAKAAIEGEKLGKGKYTDFLAVSLSSTDYIGHQFGPNSVEVEDCYLRLDKDLASFFDYLDLTLGKGNYVAFLTADHGAAHVPGFMKEKKIPAGVFPFDTVLKQLSAKLKSQYGEGEWLLTYENMQLYLNNNLLSEKKVSRSEVKKTIEDFLLQFNGIAKVLDIEHLNDELVEANMKSAIGNGFYPKRAGDMYILYEPGWFEGMPKGTTHGTVYPYDTHIPLVWMGWNIRHGENHSSVHMTDIAPTVAAMLHIQEPDGCVGKPIEGVFSK
jgi:predicted AlkP superfamily pyrophosphatase or phosphodiesterase